MYNYGRPDMKLPYRWNSDVPFSLPLAPKNIHVTSPYFNGENAYDIRWDNPSAYSENNSLNILGVNVYKAYDSPEGPYVLQNLSPVTVLSYRDQTTIVSVVDEDPLVGGRLMMGTNATKDWIVKTYYSPLIIPGTNGEYADHPKHVTVRIRQTSSDPIVTVPAFKVIGASGEIYLINKKIYNNTTNRLEDPILPDPNNGGEIYVSYTYINNLVDTTADRKIYYKVTTVAQVPDSGPTVETPLNEVEANSRFDTEKIDWIWAEAIRRNRWILEQSGERVKVFLRKWAGVRCDCWSDEYQQAKESCLECFIPGTLINTETGYKAIEKIKVGERVLSSDGKYHAVRELISKEHDGDLISIRSSVSTSPILVTLNHPFMVLRSGHGRKIKCGPKCDGYIESGDGLGKVGSARLLPSGKWWARAQMGGSRGKGRTSLGTYNTKEEAETVILKYKKGNIKKSHKLEWDNAENIKEGDWLTPQWNSDVNDLDTINIPKEFLNDKFRRIGATEFKVDEEFLWIIGIYIAEGSSGTRGITFSFHKDETAFHNKVVEFFNKYGFNPKIDKNKGGKGNGVNVRVGSTSLSRWLPKWIGDYCYNKKIPQELMFLPENKTWALIKGIYDGDGSKSDREICQTSEVLALQISDLLHRVGEQPLIRRQISRVKTPKGNSRRIAYCVSWAEDGLFRNNRKGRWIFEDKILSQVKHIDKVNYNGPVYNLSVEEDPTYVVNGIVVHNCYGTGYIEGYVGPIDIIIAPPEAERMIELMDIGLHLSYEYQTWTSVYPLLTERDFIVRQSNLRFIIAHLNQQGSRGAIYQQHFNIAPLDQKDIRYKVPISGGVANIPAAWNAYRTTRPVDASPTIPNKPEIPDQYERTGRTVTFENIMYALPWAFIILGSCVLHLSSIIGGLCV
jgi:hypothetical protein